jgi:hypothetical protein
MRAGNQLARRFVEPDVAIGAETEDLEVDPTLPPDRRLVALALAQRIPGSTIQKVDLPRRHLHAIEEMALHERAIAVRVATSQPLELVEIECRDGCQVDTARAVE